jgi:hypothetical protein
MGQLHVSDCVYQGTPHAGGCLGLDAEEAEPKPAPFFLRWREDNPAYQAGRTRGQREAHESAVAFIRSQAEEYGTLGNYEVAYALIKTANLIEEGSAREGK